MNPSNYTERLQKQSILAASFWIPALKSIWNNGSDREVIQFIYFRGNRQVD